MSRKELQAKHIDDAEVIAAVRDIGEQRYRKHRSCRWAFTWDTELAFPSVHQKVMAAKFKALIRRGPMTGCPCGCRGDFEPTDAGLALAAHVARRTRQLRYSE